MTGESVCIEHNEFLHEWKGPITSAWLFWCPGCNEPHVFTTYHDNTKGWKFDGNLMNPTFSPSLLYPDKKPRCHLHLQNGKINYCGDCEHQLNGQQNIDMVPLETKT